MYLYLYAPFLRQRKYAAALATIEGRVTEFGIGGKIAQLSQFLKFAGAIKEYGIKRLGTLVSVGDDALLEEAVNQCALSNVVLGYIPMGESVYGSALCIPKGAAAVDALAARRIKKLDLGRIENRLFLGVVRTEGTGIELHSPTFSIFPNGHAAIEVANLKAGSDATDGLLDVTVTPYAGSLFRKKPGAPTTIKVASCRLKAARPLPVHCGAHGILKMPLQIDIVPKAVRMVVGRGVRRQ